MDSLTDVTSNGDKLRMYECLRMDIAKQIEGTDSGRDVAALSRQYIDITERIAALKEASEKQDRRSPLDEFLGRRKG